MTKKRPTQQFFFSDCLRIIYKILSKSKNKLADFYKIIWLPICLITFSFICWQIQRVYILNSERGLLDGKVLNGSFESESRSLDIRLPEISLQKDTFIKLQAKNIVIYNRIPKCGSETISFLFNKMFNYNRKWGTETFWIRGEDHSHDVMKNEDYKNEFKRDILSKSKGKEGFIYIRHMRFINFHASDHLDRNENVTQNKMSSTEEWRPIWINFLRDPVSRFISDFYFQRRGPHRLRIKGKYLPINLEFNEFERNQTLEQVLIKMDDDYTKIGHLIPRIQMKYFCGTSRTCEVDGSGMRDLAIKNIRESYMFTGILEYFSESLELLELIFPEAFSPNFKLPFNNHKYKWATLTHFYKKYGDFTKETFKTFQKPVTEQWVKDRLSPFFKYEYDVYNYANSYFHEQLKYYRLNRREIKEY